MPKTEFIRARVDEGLKNNIEQLFSRLGLTMTEAITLFFKQCELNNGLPVEVKIPNAETVKTIQDAKNGVGLHRFDSPESMFEELDKD